MTSSFQLKHTVRLVFVVAEVAPLSPTNLNGPIKITINNMFQNWLRIENYKLQVKNLYLLKILLTLEIY